MSGDTVTEQKGNSKRLPVELDAWERQILLDHVRDLESRLANSGFSETLITPLDRQLSRLGDRLAELDFDPELESDDIPF